MHGQSLRYKTGNPLIGSLLEFFEQGFLTFLNDDLACSTGFGLVLFKIGSHFNNSQLAYYLPRVDVINKFQHSVVMLCNVNALRLDVTCHMTIFDQFKCFICA